MKHPPVICDPLPPIGADDVIAIALSIVRGRVFGPRSSEVKLIRLALRHQGFDVYRVCECAMYRLSAA